MKKILTSIFSFFVFLILINTASAAINVEGFFTGTQDKTATINLGESIDFDSVIYSTDYPVTYTVVLRDPDGNVVHTYANNVDADNFQDSTNTYTIDSSNFNKGGEYRVFISAIDDADSQGYDYLTLNLIASANGAPSLKLISPKDGETNLPTTVTLQWEGSDPENDKLSYVVWVNNKQECSPTEKNTCTLDNLNPGTTYSWKVAAYDGTNKVISSIWSFTTREGTVENQAPSIQLMSPRNGGQNLPQQVTLRWRASDPENDPLVYTVVLNNQILAVTEETSYELTNLYLDTIYNWKIEVSDGIHKVKSDMWTFKTADFNTAPEVNILSPRDGQGISGNHKIMWDATDDEQGSNLLHVKVEYSKSNLIRDVIRIIGINVNIPKYDWNTIFEGYNFNQYYNFNTEHINNGNYKLRITVTDEKGLSDSETISFKIANDGKVEPNNFPPEITSEPNKYARLEELYNYQLEVRDKDKNPTFSYRLLKAPKNMEISNSGLITWTPKETGTFIVNVEVSDGKYKDTQYYVLSVTDDYYDENVQHNVHKFTLANAIIRYDDDYVYVYPLIRNLGNQKEDVEIKVYNMNTNDFAIDNFNLGLSEGKFRYIIMPKPLAGNYVFKIEANSDDYHDVVLRTLEVL
jgi:hypothetical protein